jgi:hypothetical protein
MSNECSIILSFFADHAERVILDEVQAQPKIFNSLKGGLIKIVRGWDAASPK